MAARRSARDRLPELADAAVRVFTRKGFKAAQMADIAAEMGVSDAALYRYVESKEGLFHLVVRQRLLLEEFPDTDLPIPAQSLDVTLKEISDTLHGAALFPSLEDALARQASEVSDARAELEEVLRDFYRLSGMAGEAMEMIEASAVELPELAHLVDVELRRPLLEAFTTLFERRARSGHLRATPDAAATARLVVEAVSWFTRHRSGDPDGAAITDEVAEATVLDVMVHALVEEDGHP